MLTVQGELEKALAKLTGDEINTVGSGRTDSGTHARMQVVHFDFAKDPDRYPWVNALNAHLPEDIQVYEAFEAPHDFHALLSAERKQYVYYVQNSERKPLFRRDYCWHVKEPLGLNWLNEASSHLLGTHDFSSFQNTGTDVPNTTRTLFRASWKNLGPEGLIFTIVGDGFLKQMVRNIVGTQIELTWRGGQPADILKVLQACDRGQAGLTAPASGLFLNWVKYPPHLDNQCRKL